VVEATVIEATVMKATVVEAAGNMAATEVTAAKMAAPTEVTAPTEVASTTKMAATTAAKSRCCTSRSDGNGCRQRRAGQYTRHDTLLLVPTATATIRVKNGPPQMRGAKVIRLFSDTHVINGQRHS
jgi:hypothetical protein